MSEKSLRVSLHWDYYDQMHGLGRPYGREPMRDLCRAAKQARVESINFRVDAAGMTWVPAAGRRMYDEHVPGACLEWADFSRIAMNHNDAARQQTAALFRETYAQCEDPLAAAVATADEVGLQLNVYVCPYDQYWPGVPDTVVEKYPERCILSRDGAVRLPVASLAYEENRRYLLDYYDAVLAHGVADVIVYSGSHAWYAYPIDVPDDWFGFEEPAVADYREKTGIDVRREAFDIDDYYRHYGTYWTMLMKALATRQAERGRRLIVGMDMGDWQVYLPWNAGRLMTTWRHHNDWREWVSWGNVDLCVGHQANMWEYEMWPGNRMDFMPGSAEKPPYRWGREHFGAADERAFALWSFLTLHADRADVEMPLAQQGTVQEGYDGLMIREAADFEFTLGWDCLERLIEGGG